MEREIEMHVRMSPLSTRQRSGVIVKRSRPTTPDYLARQSDESLHELVESIRDRAEWNHQFAAYLEEQQA